MGIQGPSLGNPEGMEVPTGIPDSNNPPSDDGLGLSNQYLSNIPESDRAIVAKYIEDWDKGVTQRFQKIHEEYAPYKNLGVDPETLQNAILVMTQANEDPLEFFKNVRERLIEMEYDLSEIESPAGSTPVGGNSLPEFEGLPTPFVDKFSQMEKTMNSVMEFINETKSERENASAQQQLDKILTDLENKHGKFDHPAVIARIINGMNPEDAIKDYKKAWESLNNPKRDTPPPVLGGGRTALDQVDTSKLKNGQDRRTHIADILRQASQG